MAPFLLVRGTDERLTRHFQSITYIDSWAAVGLEAPSHLDLDLKYRPPSTQPLTQLSDLPRTENSGGNSWKRLRSRLGLARDDDDDDEFQNNL